MTNEAERDYAPDNKEIAKYASDNQEIADRNKSYIENKAIHIKANQHQLDGTEPSHLPSQIREDSSILPNPEKYFDFIKEGGISYLSSPSTEFNYNPTKDNLIFLGPNEHKRLREIVHDMDYLSTYWNILFGQQRFVTVFLQG